MGFLNEFQSMLGPAVGHGFSDLLAVVRNGPRETAPEATAGLIRSQDIIAAKSFSLKHKQSSTPDERFGGEGADQHTFAVGNVTLASSIRMPLIAASVGWVDPAFASLWYLAKLAYWGTGTAAEGHIVSTVSAGDNTVFTTNIADFLSIPTPFSLYIIPIDGEVAETVTVISTNKRQRRINISTPFSHSHGLGTIIAARPSLLGGAESEPGFSLLSLREGLLAPSLVSKLTIDAKSGEPIMIDAEIASIRLTRFSQIGLRDERSEIVNAYASKSPGRILNGSHVQLGTIPNNDGTFGRGSSLGDPIFQGFQGLGFPPISITGFSISVDNHVTEIHSVHSLKEGSERIRENAFPYALVSEGRTISGKITYLSPIEPRALAERLAGSSSLTGGGLYANFGPFRISMPEIGWSPSSGEGDSEESQTRTLEWKMVAQTYDAMPYLEFSDRG